MTNNKKILTFLFIPIIIFFGLFLYSYAITATTKNIPLHHGCDENNAAFIKYKVNDNKRKISFCDEYDKNTMSITSEYVEIGNYISFDYIGNPNGPDTSIYIEDEDANRYVIPKLGINGEGWSHRIVKVPEQFNKKIRIVADDSSRSKNGWVGIGNVIFEENLEAFSLPTYVETMLYILLFSFFISAVFTNFLKYYNALDSFVYMSLLLGVTSLAIFYIYLYSVEYGKIASVLIFSLIGLSFFRLKIENIKMSLLLFSLLSSMMMIILFVAYSDLDTPLNFQQISASRWNPLPVDNWIPKIFADAILREHIPSPLFGSWLSSDRPPLQTGFFLIFSIFSYSDLTYLVVSVGMQLLVIIFILMLLMKYIKEYQFIFFVMIMIFFNGFVFVHSLFVWPKLLSALFQGIAFYYLYKIWISNHTYKKDYILFGIASSLAFLSHGGSVFYLLSLSILLLFALKNKNDIKKLSYGFVSAIIVYLPWVLYQKLVDPPGDRLLKWHLAAEMHVTDKPFLEVLLAYYDKLSFSDWLNLQLSHVERIFYNFYFNFKNVFSMSYRDFHDNIFVGLDYSFLFFSIWLVFLYIFVKKQTHNIKIFILLLLGSFFIYIVIWSLLMAGRTIIHHGAFFAWFSGFLAVTWIVYSANKYIFYILGIMNLLFFIFLYIEPYIFQTSIISGMIIVTMSIIFMMVLYQLIYQRNLLFKDDI